MRTALILICLVSTAGLCSAQTAAPDKLPVSAKHRPHRDARDQVGKHFFEITLRRSPLSICALCRP